MSSPRALSWLSEMEYLRFEALVEEAEWVASLNGRAAALPELPPDLEYYLSFLDEQVCCFIALPSRGISMDLMALDKIFTDAHIRRLQILRVAQEKALEEAEFLHNFKTVDGRLEVSFLDTLRNADAILESHKEHYPAYLIMNH